MIDVFISYKREERELVFKINERLRALKVDTWFDAELRSGTAFQEEITAKVRQAKAVVVCWSAASVASRWVLAEATEGDRDGKLCPVLVEPCSIPLPFNVLHAQDLSGWNGSGDHPSWLRFLAAVGQKIGRPGIAGYSEIVGQPAIEPFLRWVEANPSDPLHAEAANEIQHRERGRLRKELDQVQNDIVARSPARKYLRDRQAGLAPAIAAARDNPETPALAERLFSGSAKRLLAIDGRRARAMLSLGVLAVLEDELRKRSGNAGIVLADYFDLIGSCSLSATIAGGLALGWDVKSVAEMYRDVLHAALKESWFYLPPFTTRYSSARKHEAVARHFPDCRIGGPEFRTGLVILAQRADDGLLWHFDNNPLRPTADNAVGAVSLRDVLHASAADAYFGEHVVDLPAGATGFVDIGPFLGRSLDLQLLTYCIMPPYRLSWPLGADRLMLCSVGAGLRRRFSTPKERRQLHPISRLTWGQEARSARVPEYNAVLLQTLGSATRPWSLRADTGDVVGEHIHDEALFDYQRIDVVLENEAGQAESVARLRGRLLTERELRQLANDHDVAARHLDELFALARLAAISYVNHAYPRPTFDIPPASFRSPATST